MNISFRGWVWLFCITLSILFWYGIFIILKYVL
uniref:Uncharacterized protein n=1 Tax=Klebsiella pneumoniae TaxID=573 RepID=A0A486VZ20_KLEPN|nr:Uncharacterised protein [Klebsiella pneumoniae]